MQQRVAEEAVFRATTADPLNRPAYRVLRASTPPLTS